jgi:hypothetical protein
MTKLQSTIFTYLKENNLKSIANGGKPNIKK